ncbi:MAG: LysM peptidoglycan-binding domain-containing M23 family metallopeptidase [Treponema sp.]
MKSNIKKSLFYFYAVIFPLLAFSNENFETYPLIKDLNISDNAFKQYCDDVLLARRTLARGILNEELPIQFYRYKVKKDDSIIRIAARCSIPYDGIITINRIQSIKDDLTDSYILLPTVPALYLPEQAGNPIENLIVAAMEKEILPMIDIYIISKNEKRKVFCIPNATFDGTTRAYLLHPLYRFPLESGILTSSFGKRASPFTGKPSYHPGIDLAAPTGSPVFACTSGVIKEVSYSRIYGNYIILLHQDGKESLYGHLSKVLVNLHDKIKSGKIIGEVGSTGLSTGPHLHFEIRVKGVPQDPQTFIEKRK